MTAVSTSQPGGGAMPPDGEVKVGSTSAAGGDGMASKLSSTDRIEKKRVQNRVAQRSYRLRMKSRVEELQARIRTLEHANAVPSSESVELLEQLRSISRPSGATSTSSDSVSMPIPPLYPSSSSGEDSNELWNLGGMESMDMVGKMSIASQSQRGESSEDTTLFSFDGLGSANAMDHTGAMDGMNGTQSGENPSTPPRVAAEVSQWMEMMTALPTSNVAIDTPRPQQPPQTSTRRPSTSSRLSSQAQPTPEDTDTSTDGLISSHYSIEPPWPSMPAPDCVAKDGSIATRLRFVAEQAKGVGFESLDDMITTYYGFLSEDTSRSLHMDEPTSRRLPRMIATLRHAVSEWRDWERRGFPLD